LRDSDTQELNLWPPQDQCSTIIDQNKGKREMNVNVEKNKGKWLSVKNAKGNMKVMRQWKKY
jgi:hypothetical protein